MNTPPFEEFSDFLREFIGVSSKTVITFDTKFETDLGVTGDDGQDLLEETEKKYKISLSTPEDGYRTIFGLKSDEFLFHSEGLNLLAWFLPKEKVIDFTVGQLYHAVVRTIENSKSN